MAIATNWHNLPASAAHSLNIHRSFSNLSVVAFRMSQLETHQEVIRRPTSRFSGDMSHDHSRAQSNAPPMSDATAAPNHPPGDTVPICAEFLAQLSHEMRTPLSSILGVSQMMLEGDLTDAQQE